MGELVDFQIGADALVSAYRQKVEECQELEATNAKLGELIDELRAELSRTRRSTTNNGGSGGVMGDDSVKRKPGCLCTWEEGDSPCPLHSCDCECGEGIRLNPRS